MVDDVDDSAPAKRALATPAHHPPVGWLDLLRHPFWTESGRQFAASGTITFSQKNAVEGISSHVKLPAFGPVPRRRHPSGSGTSRQMENRSRVRRFVASLIAANARRSWYCSAESLEAGVNHRPSLEQGISQTNTTNIR
jgi:hypothetical protein